MEKKWDVEFVESILVGLCAVLWLVLLIFGLVLLEGLLDKKLGAVTAVLRASVFGGYAVILGTLMVSCVLGTASCFVRRRARSVSSLQNEPSP